MQDSNKYSFSFVSFDAHQPPKVAEVKGKDYLIFGDDKNSEWYNRYPDYLLDNYNRAATHNAICNGKINYIVGNGLEVKEYQDVESLAIAKGLIRSVNEYQDADDFNRCIVPDLVIFGGFFVELIPNKLKELASTYHLPFQNLRRDKQDDKKYYYTCDWSANRPELNDDWKEFYVFEGKFEQGKNYLLEYRIHRAGYNPYPLPDYMSANTSIESEWRIDNFLLNNIKNGFSAGFLINFYNGMPTEEEKRDIERQIKKKFTGDEAGGSFVLNFNSEEAKSAEIIPIPTNGQDDRFNLLGERINQKEFTAHNVTSPMLFGVKTAGQLGGRTELIEAFELFQNTYVNDKQRIVEKFWNDMLYFRGVDAKLEIVETTPLQEKLGDDVRISVMTQDEIREELGLKPLGQQTEMTKFSDEKDQAILDHLASCGFNDEDLEVVYSRGILAASIEEAMEFAEVTTFENSVLGLLRQELPPQQIAKALDAELPKVMDAINNLEAEGYIKIKDNNYEITKSGEEASTEEVMVVYKYALRPDAPPLKTESRPFCRQLMSLSSSRSWSIEDIKRMRNGQGLDCFAHRGGWYTKPDTDIRIPYCRHRWEQRLVKLKK